VFFDQIHLAAHTPEFGVAIFLAAGGCAALAVVTGLAGLRLFDLRSHTLGVLAAIFSMLPLTAVVLVGLPIGIWALVVLLRRDVREAFEERSRELKRERKQKLTPVDAAAALDVLRSPGMGLIVSGLLVLIASAPSAMFFSEEGLGLHDSSGYYAMAMALMIVTGLGIAALLIAAGVLMRRAWAYPVCVIATLTAILPFSMAWVFTIPFGLWALVVLLRQDVRELFASGADVGEMLRHPAPPAKPADPRHSGYYAAGQLTGVLVRFLASKQFVIVVCVVGMATVLLPWGKAIFERPDGGLWDGPNLYGWECWTPSIVAFAFLLLLLIVIATGGIRELEVWRPLLLAGFALPILAMSFGFSVIESFLQRFSQVEPLARIDPQGGHFVALAAAVGLLLCAALQFRSSVASR
jgi:hypothetical protein